MGWTLMMFERAKAHLCHDSLADALAADMLARGHAECSRRPSGHSIGIDRGGMIVASRPIEEWPWAGALFHVASECVSGFAVDLDHCPLWRFADGQPYYKLHSHFTALTMTPAQRDELLALLRASVRDAEARALMFYAGRQPAHEVLREANARAVGMPVSAMPDCGGHEADRFHKPKGSA